MIDFGGSLGSSYYQNRIFLDAFGFVSWNIVEQKHFVDIGREQFENERLKFYYDTYSAKAASNAQVIIFSSVLQYIQNPKNLLHCIFTDSYKYVIVDRTPFAKCKTIKKQVVPPYIYDASVPCWFFEENEFLGWFSECGFRVIEEFNSGIDTKGRDYDFKGYLLERINNEKVVKTDISERTI